MPNVVEWCKERILMPDAEIVRRGKNWYITADDVTITFNANLLTLQTSPSGKEIIDYLGIFS